MRTFLAVVMVLGLTGGALPPQAAAELPVGFQVPSPERVAEGAWALPTHELILPADVIARRGESFEEAVLRAIAGVPDTAGETG